MRTELLSHGPEDAAEDEQVIAKSYRVQPMLLLIPIIALGAAAQFGDLKWVIAVGFFFTIQATNEAHGRLYDLCIRVRRTNLLLRR